MSPCRRGLFFFFFLHIFICTESWRTLRTLLQFFPVSVSLSPWQRQGAHSFLTQRIQGSFFVTLHGVIYSSGLWVKRWPLSTSVVNSVPLSVTSIVRFNLWPKDLEQLTRWISFIFWLTCGRMAERACPSAHVFGSPILQTPERRRTRLRSDLSNSAAETKSALRPRLVRESRKSIKFGIILCSVLQGGPCASGLHSYHSFEGTDDSTVRAQG